MHTHFIILYQVVARTVSTRTAPARMLILRSLLYRTYEQLVSGHYFYLVYYVHIHLYTLVLVIIQFSLRVYTVDETFGCFERRELEYCF